MAEVFGELNDKHIEFIKKQTIFFTATAASQGTINLSPKGMDTFRIIDNNTVAYLDLTGSGNETAAHLHQLPRMTIMMCSFDKQPLIFRMYGKGFVINQYRDEWQSWQSKFPMLPGTRQIIGLNIDKIQTSCGYAVPTADNFQTRETLKKWAEKKGDEGVVQYWKDNNVESLDGFPTHIFEDNK